MSKLWTILFLFMYNSSFSQINWSEDVAPIIYANCTTCHNENGIGEFSLIDYSNASAFSHHIMETVESKEMPPWVVDRSYQNYSSERVLTEEEITTIVTWVNEGAIEGDPSLAPPKPVYNNIGYIQEEADLVLQIPTYTSKATSNSDDYVCFTIPSGISSKKRIKAIEVIPGNIEIVHHALVFIDPYNSTQTDTSGNCASPSGGNLATGYVPGSTPTVFPSDETFRSGMTMEAGSDIILSMHYPEGSAGKTDDTKVKFYFYDDGLDVREVTARPVLQNWNFYLPEDQETTLNIQFPNVGSTDRDLTIMSVFPHMHLLGKSIKSYAITAEDQIIPFVNIPQWDFEWQDFYFFKNLIKLPQGSVFYGSGVYDNTANNPSNPSTPPVGVGPGLNTLDEMFLFYFHYMDYVEGDELINVDSLSKVYLPTKEIYDEFSFNLSVFPNPITAESSIQYELAKASFVSAYIYDIRGQLIQKIYRGHQNIGKHVINWDSSALSQGVYFLSMRINGQNIQQRIVKI